MPQLKKRDRRVERTRLALLNAFRALILERGYDRMTIRDIVEAADVGRSTFYEHFESKDDILRQSLTGPFCILADAAADSHVQAHLEMIVAHFWENGRLGRVIFSGSPRRVVTRRLAELIEERLAAAPGSKTEPVIPLRLVAAHLAEAQLGLIEAWVGGKTACSAETLARAIALSTKASVNALLRGAN